MAEKPTYKELEKRILELERAGSNRKHAEEVLKRSEEKFSRAFHLGPLMMAISSIEDGTYQDVNGNFVRVTGYSREESIGTTSVDLGVISKEDRDRLKHEITQSGRVDGIEMKLHKKDGDTLYCQYFGEIIMIDGEQRLLSIASDISDRKQTEEALQQFECIVSSSHDMMALLNNDFIYITANDAYLNAFGKARDEIIGHSVPEVFGEKFFEKVIKNNAEQCMAGHEVRYSGWFEFPVRGRSYMDIEYSPYWGDNKTIKGFVVNARDITEYKRAEEALRDREAHLRTLIETIPDLVWLKDPYGVYISCNLKFERFFGAKETAIKGKTDHAFVDKELADFFREKDKAAMAAGIPIINEEEVTYADDGHKELLETIKTPMYDSEGKLVGVLGIARDITERKHAENLVRALSQTLMQAQERERKIISCELHDSIAQDLSALKLYCNRLFEKHSSPESDIKGLPEDVSTLIDKTITTVRDLAYNLRPPSLDHIGLVHALEVFCEEFTEKNNTVVDFQAAGIHESILKPDIQINLYRLVIEGLNNIRKHAAASKVIIRLVGAYPNLILRIKDNGKGFDVKERERSTLNEKRMGLRSMNERVNLLQGQISIHSQLNKGTEIVIRLPLKDKQ